MADFPSDPIVACLLVLASSTGGVGRHVASLAAELGKRGCRVSVAGPAATDAHFGFTAAGAAFVPVEIAAAVRPGADARAVRALAAAARAARPDVVHAHGLRAGAVAVLARRRPLVVSLHNQAPPASGPRAALLCGLERLVGRGADVVLGASPDLTARARELGARDARPGPVAAPRLGPPARDRAAVRAELGAGGRPLVLAVGRLAPQKDYPTLLTASLAWRRLDPTPLVAVAGEGPLGPDLQARIDAGDLPVRLLGHRSDVADLLAAADLVVLPSRWEARALVAQEALRTGTPLVATAVGGVPELVGEAAVLVPPHDPHALAAGVARVLADPALAARLAEAGRRRAATWPDEADVAESVLALYRELAPRRPGREGG